MPGRPPTVALVGGGRWGRNILRDLLALGARVVVADRDAPARAAALAAGAAKAVAEASALPELDGAVVATPTTTHVDVVRALLGRGIPIFVEKPLAPDADAARALAAEGRGRLFVMHKWRYHPGVECLSAIARSGELGPVRSVTTCRLGWGGPHADVDPVWILAPHDLSIALEILGTVPKPRFARAQSGAGGAVGLTGLLGDDPWASIEVSALGPRRREVRVAFRDGTAVLAAADARDVLVQAGFDPRTETAPAPRARAIGTEAPLWRELRAFLGHLTGGPPPRSTADEEAEVVSAIAGLRALAL